MNLAKSRRKKESWDDIIFDLICNVLVLIVVIAIAYPIYFVLIASISDPKYVNFGDPLLYPKGFTLDGYREVFKNREIWIGYANTIYYTVFGTLIALVCTMLGGYALSRRDLPGRGIIMIFFTFTMYFGGGMIPTYYVVKNLGLLNTRTCIIIMGAVSVYNMIVVRSFMQSNIPEELREAALIDGCGNGYFFTKIVLPLSKAIIAVIVLYDAVGMWNSYFSAMIYLQDKNMHPLQLILRRLLITTQAMASDTTIDADAAAEMLDLVQNIKYSIIVVATAPILCVYPFIQKYFVKGVMIGSIKG
ncbi:MAG: carbohydrate ABC transporter permease [Lachnospiraceae bacterium]|nr:carbohydrate ABC transporter permease [Lachnospiraceae bacterium]